MSGGYVMISIGDVSAGGTYIDALHLAGRLISCSATSADALDVSAEIWTRAFTTALRESTPDI